jgi:hypothetical protein
VSYQDFVLGHFVCPITGLCLSDSCCFLLVYTCSALLLASITSSIRAVSSLKFMLHVCSRIFRNLNTKMIFLTTSDLQIINSHMKCSLKYRGPNTNYINSLIKGRAVAQAVSSWLPIAAARVRVRAACGICCGQTGIGAGFLRVLRFLLPIIPPISPSS